MTREECLKSLEVPLLRDAYSVVKFKLGRRTVELKRANQIIDDKEKVIANLRKELNQAKADVFRAKMLATLLGALLTVSVILTINWIIGPLPIVSGAGL